MMEVDEDELLCSVASGAAMDYSLWPALLPRIVARIEKIAHEEFPIPKLPRQPPTLRSSVPNPNHNTDANVDGDQPLPSDSLLSPPLPSSPTAPDAPGVSTSTDPAKSPAAPDADGDAPEGEASSQEANKENAPAPATPQPTTEAPPPCESPPPGALPIQVDIMLKEITSTLTSTFPTYPPHTFQRLAELVLSPKSHYRSLPTYLHALDRVVHVTSGLNVYPLPLPVPEAAESSLLSNGTSDLLAAPSTWAAPGSDEALGGALLTPIPWLKPNRQESPGSQQGARSTATPDPAEPAGSQTAPAGGDVDAEVRTESTETIDGPNGVGSIETVSISVNGVPSMGARGVGVTQGELLRQEQRAGIVPVSQLVPGHHAAAARHMNSMAQQQTRSSADPNAPDTSAPDDEGDKEPDASAPEADEDAPVGSVAASDDEKPHARGPEEIGPEDMGPQPTGSVGVDVDMQEIDVEAAVGRKPDSANKTEDEATATAAEGGEGAKKDNEDEEQDAAATGASKDLGEDSAGKAPENEEAGDKMDVEGESEDKAEDKARGERETTPKHKAEDEDPGEADKAVKKPKLEGEAESGADDESKDKPEAGGDQEPPAN